MRNIYDFENWKIFEKKTETEYSNEDDTLVIDNEKYKISDNGDVTEVDDSGEEIKIDDDKKKKYVKIASDAAEEASDHLAAYNIDRKTGRIEALKTDLKKAESEKNIIKSLDDKSGFMNTIINDDDLKNVGGCKYIKINDNDSRVIKRIFGITTDAVGKGEVLLPSLYNDVRRKGYNEKGDDETVNGEIVNIEVKSGGASFGVPSETPKEMGPEYACAYSIAKYICARNLKQIYLVIFDNGVIEKNIDNKEIDTENDVEQCNDNGLGDTSGFFIMNCGVSTSPNGGKTKENAENLAEEIKKLIEIKGLENNRKEDMKFTIRYKKPEGENDNGKIICMVNDPSFFNKWGKPKNGK